MDGIDSSRKIYLLKVIYFNKYVRYYPTDKYLNTLIAI